jgi:hypothetical protein
MAIGKASDLTIYHEQFLGGYVETVQQNVNAFNAASGGAIRLINELHIGDYDKETFFDVVASLVSRRDTTSTSTATDLALTSDEFVGVKLNRKIGPVAQTLDAWRKINKDEKIMSMILGEQTAKATAQEMLNTALSAVEAKLDSVAALEHGATDGTCASTDLASGLAKFGDAAGNIVIWVMHSKVYYDLLGNQITNAIYRANNTRIMDGVPATLGRPVLITDSSSLIEDDGVSSGIDVYSTLGLVPGAIEIKESEPPTTVLDLVTGLENIVYRFQGEYAYTLKLRGCEWDTGNGGANPSANSVATASNWDTQVADNKLLPGIIIKSR